MAYRIYKRGRIYWAYVYFPGSGKRGERVSTGCTDPRAADTRAREIERRSIDPVAAAESSDITLVDALSRLRAEKAKRAAGTQGMYRTKAKRLLGGLGPDLLLSELVGPEGARRVDAYIDGRRAVGTSDNTIGKELTALRQALKIAKRRGEWTGELNQIMPFDWSDGYVPRKTFLAESDCDRFLDELPPHRAAVAAFILATTARDSEWQRAHRRDVDLRRGFVTLRGTKTEASARVVPVTDIGRPLLERALRDASGRLPLLFEPWGNIRRDIGVRARALKIGRETKDGNWWLTPNDLRRTASTWLLHRGVDTFALSKVLGHKSTRMVERVYGVMPPEALAKLIRERLAAPEKSQLEAEIERLRAELAGRK